jgi:DNA topoisomerase-1
LIIIEERIPLSNTFYLSIQMKYLVIVESPAKRQKIQSYLNAMGNGHTFTVLASMGHIRKIANGLKSIDMSNYDVSYAVDSAKRKAVSELVEASKKADAVILATDPDREGEAIAFHLAAVLKLKPEECLRMTFNEITQSAIKKAFDSIGELNANLYYAQETRAVLDLLIGYEISPVLWRYIQSKLSAGRCQSPALRLIYEREKEIAEFKSDAYYHCSAVFHRLPKVIASYDGNSKTKKTTSNPLLTSESDIQEHLPNMMNTEYTLKLLATKDSQSSPSAPYITSTIQQDASSKLGMNPKTTMRTLQTLYEKGFITYMRTDSTTMSETAHREVAAYVGEHYKGNYQRRDYKKKVANAQEAHECIRPVKIALRHIQTDDSYEKKLYDLVWSRTVASQMKASKEEIVSIQWKSKVYSFSASLTRIIDPGYKVIYESRLQDDSKQIEEIVAMLDSNESIIEKPQECSAEQKYTRPPSRYTEASIIRELEEKGIGRPSTFASIISTLLERSYVCKDDAPKEKVKAMAYTINRQSMPQIKEVSKEIALENDRNKLILTPIGRSVCEFLNKNFDETIQDYDFTKTIEEGLDEISRGEKSKKQIIELVYSNFHPIVEKLLKEKKETRITNHNLSEEQRETRSIIDDRPDKFNILGKHPESNHPLYLHYGRYGTCIAEMLDDGKLKYYSIPSSMKNIQMTIDKALELMLYPRVIGELDDGTKILVKSGPYGFYIEYGTTRIPFAKLNGTYNPATITAEELSDVIENDSVGTTILREFKDGLKVVKRNDKIYIQKGKKEAKCELTEDAIKSVLKKTLVELLDTNGKEMGKTRRFFKKTRS